MKGKKREMELYLRRKTGWDDEPWASISRDIGDMDAHRITRKGGAEGAIFRRHCLCRCNKARGKGEGRNEQTVSYIGGTGGTKFFLIRRKWLFYIYGGGGEGHLERLGGRNTSSHSLKIPHLQQASKYSHRKEEGGEEGA